MLDLPESVFPTVTVFAAAGIVFFAAELIYVAFGFGAGLVAVGLLSLIMPEPKDVVVVLLLVNLPVELGVVWSSRKDIRWKGLVVMLAGIGAGTLLGTWILVLGKPTVLLTILGVFLVATGVAFTFAINEARTRFPVWTVPVVGLSSGLLAGLFGTGGPPLVVYYRLRGTSKALFRSSLMAIFLVMTAVRLPAYTFSGLITAPRLTSALALLPAAIMGALLGQRIHVELPEVAFQRFVGVALAVIGAILLIRHVM